MDKDPTAKVRTSAKFISRKTDLETKEKGACGPLGIGGWVLCVPIANPSCFFCYGAGESKIDLGFPTGNYKRGGREKSAVETYDI